MELLLGALLLSTVQRAAIEAGAYRFATQIGWMPNGLLLVWFGLQLADVFF